MWERILENPMRAVFLDILPKNVATKVADKRSLRVRKNDGEAFVSLIVDIPRTQALEALQQSGATGTSLTLRRRLFVTIKLLDLVVLFQVANLWSLQVPTWAMPKTKLIVWVMHVSGSLGCPRASWLSKC